MERQMPYPSMGRLAWHETLDMHELVAFQSVGLIKLKKSIRKVKDPALKKLYAFAIQALTNNLRELLAFYPAAPHVADEVQVEDHGDISFYAGDLLGLAKTSVRNYSIAITETATPVLREVLAKQLIAGIQLHGMVFYYMLQRGLYPAYDLNQLLNGDVRNATNALSMPY
ncbi:spore coat protein F [Marinithermofilum abyssi]|uniref:Spore coat protein F n=2 Tax=Marinithermofilum abyssi TaxID=1571185 RepID=A0A8J2VEW0_9BACL|nr:spore coat protein F [Marinithermofilum abyssi]